MALFRNLLKCHASRNFTNYQINRHPGTRNNRLTESNIWINSNILTDPLLFHKHILPDCPKTIQQANLLLLLKKRIKQNTLTLIDHPNIRVPTDPKYGVGISFDEDVTPDTDGARAESPFINHYLIILKRPFTSIILDGGKKLFQKYFYKPDFHQLNLPNLKFPRKG